MVAAISGLTAAQNAALAAVEVGDLIFVQKAITYEDDDEDEEDEEAEDEHDEIEDDDDDEGESEAGNDDESEQDDENGGRSSENGEEATGLEAESDEEEGDPSAASSDAQGTTSTADTSTIESHFTPAMYVATAVTKNDEDIITDLQVASIPYSANVGDERGHRTYQIYANQCVTHHDNDCEECEDSQSITDVANADTFTFQVKPNGDQIRRFIATNPRTRCISKCNDGWLDNISSLPELIKDYDSPFIAGPPLPGFLQRPVCPVCVGVPLLDEQQAVILSLMAIGPGNATQLFGDIVEFHGHLNQRRRTQLRYSFKQFDEREWGFGIFDDMLSDEDVAGGRATDGGRAPGHVTGGARFEHWAEAMDPSNNAPLRPASDTTIATLSRKSFSAFTLSKEAESTCIFCTEELVSDTMMLELPCQHMFEEECIVKWLKQYDNCPTCRAQVPPVYAEGEEPPEEKARPIPVPRMDRYERQDYADAGDHFSSINGLGLSGDAAIAAALAASLAPASHSHSQDDEEDEGDGYDDEEDEDEEEGQDGEEGRDEDDEDNEEMDGEDVVMSDEE